MRGRHVQVQVDQPAAGSNWTFRPSNTDRVRLLTITAQLTTNSEGTARGPVLEFKDQSGIVYLGAGATASTPASGTIRYSWARGLGVFNDTVLETTGFPYGQLPDIWLEPGDTVSALTAGIKSGDQWNQIVYRAIVCSHLDWERWQEQLELALAG